MTIELFVNIFWRAVAVFWEITNTPARHRRSQQKKSDFGWKPLLPWCSFNP